MSRSGKIREFFGDGMYELRLGVAEAEELQDLTDCGLMGALERVGDVRVREIKHVIRLGLVGAGLPKEKAWQLVERHVTDGYLSDCAGLAVKVIEATVKGVEDEPLGGAEGTAAPTAAPRSRAAKSGSESSTARPSKRASARTRSDAGPSGS